MIIFQGKKDRFSGITVSSEDEPTTAQEFETVLQGKRVCSSLCDYHLLIVLHSLCSV